MTDMYMRNDNLKRTGQLRNVRVESGFVTVCGQGGPFFGRQNDIIARIAESSSN